MTREPENADPVNGRRLSHRSTAWGLGRWAMVVLVLFSFVLGIFNLGGREFWLDEAVSSYISGLGWAETIEYVRNAPWEHPPFYYLALSPWQVSTGRSEFAFRFFSLLWGVLTIPLLYAMVKRLASERLALLAAMLATISPFVVAHSQEARMYTMLPCLALLALIAFWNGLKQGGRATWWLAYLVLIVVGVMTHYYFVLIWAATTLHLLLEWLHRRRVRGWAYATQAVLLLLTVAWFVSAPGLRKSLASVGQTAMDFSPTYKLVRIMPTLMLAALAGDHMPRFASILTILGWSLVLLGLWWSRRDREIDARAWLLLALFLVVPLAGSLLLPWAKGRHLGFVLIPVFVFGAAGLLALRRAGRVPLVMGVVTVLVLSAYGLVAHYTASSSSFDPAMRYVDDRGQPGDALVLSQPLQRPLESYYNHEEWPAYYVPFAATRTKPAEVQKTLSEVSQQYKRIWLGPVGPWTADPEYLSAQWLAANAFQAEKRWFPDSSSVTLFVTGQEGLAPVELDDLDWEGRIYLRGLVSSSLEVQVGDALRLRFSWQAGDTMDGRYEVSLRLVDEQGQVWAEGRGEPCGGWCPTDEWSGDDLVQDQHALVIPPATPPGTYRLETAWLPVGGGLPLHAEQNGVLTDRVALTEVTILPDALSEEPWDLPNRNQITFDGQVTLLGYEPALANVPMGGALVVTTYWRAEESPSADYVLALELVDSREQVVAESVSLLTPSYPTSLWQRGVCLRDQRSLYLPGSLAPGRYALRIALLSPEGERLTAVGKVSRPAQLRDGNLLVATVRVEDRQRRFDLPSVSNTVGAKVGRQVQLVGYDLVLDEAYPGGQLTLTLYWEADGPMALPFKIFTHLVDADGIVRAQHDAPPGGGCCPANTWVDGEVIIDQHPIALGTELAPDQYRLVVGMYDEETGNRVPAYDADGTPLAHDGIEITEVTVEAISVQGEDEITLPEVEDVHAAVFLPLVMKRVPQE